MILRSVSAWMVLSLAACGGAAQLAPPRARPAAPTETVEASVPKPSAAPAQAGPTTRVTGAGEATPRGSASPVADLATVAGSWKCRWADDPAPETWEIRANGSFVRRYPMGDGATTCVVDGKLELLEPGKVTSVERTWAPAECSPPPEHQAVATTHTLMGDGEDRYWFGGTLEASGDNELSCARVK
ncbi:MAG: hypothetical protein IPG04_35815 [Polyangiaceae bacterium]|nr:hypothetical protein [Polyangiaceae bacterium]